MRAAIILLCACVIAQAAIEDCKFEGTLKNARATVIDQGNTLRSDGLGTYVTDANVFTFVNIQAALNIFPLRRAFSPNAVPRRHMIVDLTNPVPNGGGTPRGIVRSWAGPHSYWRLDADKRVHGVQEIPVGTTTESDLTAIFISSDDGATMYLLQMGPWSWQTCENFGPVETRDSTRAIITRTGEKTWTSQAPAGSIGVLHDIRDARKPVPLGLYYINFEIHYTLE